jgi:ABC-type polysaccharide/polyol phosphate export permease
MPIRFSKAFINRLERIYLFANHDYYIRYYGSKLGIFWAFLNPFFQILIFYFTFTVLIFRQRDPDFILYLFTGIITWQFFADTSKSSIHIFQKQRFILQNIGLPKIDFFWALIGSKFWGYMVNFVIFFLFYFIAFDGVITLKYFFLIPIWMGLIMFSLGVAFVLSTLYIFFRDLDHLWSIVLMAGFWTVPIIWDYKILYTNYSAFFYFPITTYLVNIRKIILYNELPDMHYLWISLLISAVIACVGYFLMHKFSKKALEFL